MSLQKARAIDSGGKCGIVSGRGRRNANLGNGRQCTTLAPVRALPLTTTFNGLPESLNGIIQHSIADLEGQI
ncbi:hypothetical protein PM082_014530 [Marasmius tenuissimus]|nr:hypothetical protein PM082_014530 [Marasmius tenuissimus]